MTDQTELLLIEESDNIFIGAGQLIYFARPQLIMEPGTFEGTEQELAAVIQRQIETYPETFDMGSYIDNDDLGAVYGADKNEELKALREKSGPMCGTTLCIAGYAQLFVDGKITNQVNFRAAELLGLAFDTQLFFTDDETAKKVLPALADGTFSEELINEYEGERYEHDEY